jgi:signal transduction histidine kinase
MMKHLHPIQQIRTPVILAVDDQEPNIRLVGAILTQSGYEVIPAFDGEQALARAAVRTPDLILLDMRMPGLDGFAVVERLRSDPRTRDVPVIFLTAAAEREHLVKAFAAGAVDYLTKPFVAEELIARVRAHIELKLARDHLQRVAREREEIAALVAHDLKNPLSSIRFSAQLMRSGEGGAERAGRLIDVILAAADNGLAFIQKYLDKRADFELRRRLELATVRLDDALHYACKRFSVQAEVRGIDFDCQNFVDASVIADPNALAHVLDNLISNALRYSPAGSAVAIVMGVGSAGRARIAVLDSGPGVSAAQRRQLFQRFTRLDAGTADTRGESSGLGLALAKQDVEQMQGELWYEDRPGGGAVFILELPLATPAQAEQGDTPMPPTDQPMP